MEEHNGLATEGVSEPRTEAGRDLLFSGMRPSRDAIRAIEDEAARKERDKERERIAGLMHEAMPMIHENDDRPVAALYRASRAAVLAAITDTGKA